MGGTSSLHKKIGTLEKEKEVKLFKRTIALTTPTTLDNSTTVMHDIMLDKDITFSYKNKIYMIEFQFYRLQIKKPILLQNKNIKCIVTKKISGSTDVTSVTIVH